MCAIIRYKYQSVIDIYFWLSSATCSDSWFASDVDVGLIATLRTIFSVTTAVSARVTIPAMVLSMMLSRGPWRQQWFRLTWIPLASTKLYRSDGKCPDGASIISWKGWGIGLGCYIS